MDIGGELRAARQAQALSLEEISQTTKISPAVLRAIEQNAFYTVPRGVFTRGYLTAYARRVGLDPDPIVQRYREMYEPSPHALGPGDPASSEPLAAPFDPGDNSGTRHSRMIQTAVILIVAAVYLTSLRTPRPAAEMAAAPAAAAAVSQAAVPVSPSSSADAVVGTSGALDTAKTHLSIEIQPQGPCWVDATVDGEHTVARLMDAGDRESITARDGVTLRVGDPGTFRFTIDGVPGRALGPEGQPVTVQITRENRASFAVRP